MTKMLELPEDLAARIAAERINDDDLIQAVRRIVEQKSLSRQLSNNDIHAEGHRKAAEFEAWAASHTYVTAVVLDDSRESMYEE